jgi:hypothetical protein
MDTLDWQRLEVEEFFGTSQAKSSAKVGFLSLSEPRSWSRIPSSTDLLSPSQPNGKKPSRYTSLFDDEPTVDE